MSLLLLLYIFPFLDYQTSKTLRVFADIVTILLCVLSMVLCSRSLFRQLKLVKVKKNLTVTVPCYYLMTHPT